MPSSTPSPEVPRRNAIDTLRQTLGWTTDAPILVVAFFVVQLLDTLGEVTAAGGLLSLLAFFLGIYVGGIAYVYAASELGVETDLLVDGGQVRFGEAAGAVLERLVPLLGVGILWTIVTVLGLLFFVLPGIYLGARLVLAFPACVLDGQGTFESLSTSWEVGQGNVAKLVGIFLVLLVVVFAFGIVVVGGGLLVFDGGLEQFLASPIVWVGGVAFLVVSAILNAAVELAIGRVYLENRPGEPSTSVRA